MTLYGLFEKVDRKWVRIPGTGAYKKETAIRVFQDRLIFGSLNGKPLELRKVKPTA